MTRFPGFRHNRRNSSEAGSQFIKGSRWRIGGANLYGMISDVQTDPAKNSANALGSIRQQSDSLGSAQCLADGWPPSVGCLTDGEPTNFKLSTTRSDFEDLQSGRISCVAQFCDVSRLMYALNENVHVGGWQRRRPMPPHNGQLLQVALELVDAQVSVNRNLELSSRFTALPRLAHLFLATSATRASILSSSCRE